MIRSDDLGCRGIRLHGNALVAVYDLRARNREVVVEQADTLVPALAQDRVLHGERPGETVDHVVAAFREDAAADEDAAARRVVDVEAVLVVRHEVVALAEGRQDFLDVRVFAKQRRAVLQLGPGDRVRDERTLDRDVGRAAGEHRLARRFSDHTIAQGDVRTGDIEDRAFVRVADGGRVRSVADEAVIERDRLRGADDKLAPARVRVEGRDADRRRERAWHCERAVDRDLFPSRIPRAGCAVDEHVRAGLDRERRAHGHGHVAGDVNDSAPRVRARERAAHARLRAAVEARQRLGIAQPVRRCGEREVAGIRAGEICDEGDLEADVRTRPIALVHLARDRVHAGMQHARRYGKGLDRILPVSGGIEIVGGTGCDTCGEANLGAVDIYNRGVVVF